MALSNSSNEFEAALAATHAQRLLSEHNLGMADINASHKPDKAEKSEMDAVKTLRGSNIHWDAYFKGRNDGRQVGINQGVEQSRTTLKGLLDNQ